ncbi:MAG TPA: hypothetical protein VJW20_20360 [Candidatus Angelobacter sp.]|nr:hypothetical protein [Candidatus Angelobacter sp.]
MSGKSNSNRGLCASRVPSSNGVKRFSFEKNFKGRLLLQRVERHIAQAECSYALTTGLFNPPPRDAAFWIVERLLVNMESEFDAARTRRKKRAA